MANKKNVDRISRLPDAVLHHILSFLNTKQVIQTCVLSKRWKCVWTRIPTLNFDFPSSGQNACSKEKSFKQFIFRVLSEHRSESIQKLSYSSTSDTEDAILVLQLLMCYARSHMVEELCLNTCKFVYTSWPCCLLDCSSLTVLKIVCEFVKNWEALKLPSLRILEIGQCVWEYPDPIPKYKGIKMISCDYPNLESLVLINYLAESAYISVPKLENLEFCVSPEGQLTFPEIQLCTPNLKSVKFSNVLPTIYDLSLLCIHKVNMEVRDSNFERKGSHSQKAIANFSELLIEFGSARSLTVPSKGIEMLLSVHTTLDEFYFPNLRHLKLKTKETDKMRVIHLPRSTLAFLQKCPNLEMLAVDPNQE